jgi:hypothetical protein
MLTVDGGVTWNMTNCGHTAGQLPFGLDLSGARDYVGLSPGWTPLLPFKRACFISRKHVCLVFFRSC